MPRRTLEPFAVVQLVLRLAALATAVAALIALILDAKRYGRIYVDGQRIYGHHKHGFAIATASVAMSLDLWESITLVDVRRKLKRIPSPAMAGFDLIVLSCGIISVIVDLFLSNLNLGHGHGPVDQYAPWRKIETQALWLMLALTIETGFLLLLDSIGCCMHVADRRRLLVDLNDNEMISTAI